MNQEYTDHEILEALRQGGAAREQAWEHIYKTWRDVVVGFIVAKEGTKTEAMECIAEVAKPFEKAVCKPEFALKTARLRTYFITCVHHRWLKKRQKKQPPQPVEFEDQHIGDLAENVETHIWRAELASLIDRTLDHVGERCKRILNLFRNGFKMQEIAERMGFSGEQTAKNEKLKCQNRYENYLRQNPEIQQKIQQLRHD